MIRQSPEERTAQQDRRKDHRGNSRRRPASDERAVRREALRRSLARIQRNEERFGVDLDLTDDQSPIVAFEPADPSGALYSTRALAETFNRIARNTRQRA